MYMVDNGVLEMERHLRDLQYVHQSVVQWRLWSGIQRGKNRIAPEMNGDWHAVVPYSLDRAS